MFGYLGAGMTEMARALFGRVKAAARHDHARWQPSNPRTPRQPKKLGIAYLTENRRATIFPRMRSTRTSRWPISTLGASRFSGIESEIEVGQATLVQRTGVRPTTRPMLAGHLSGGNQQKVVLAKWLTKQPRVLILNEPTRGWSRGGNAKCWIWSGR